MSSQCFLFYSFFYYFPAFSVVFMEFFISFSSLFILDPNKPVPTSFSLYCLKKNQFLILKISPLSLIISFSFFYSFGLTYNLFFSSRVFSSIIHCRSLQFYLPKTRIMFYIFFHLSMYSEYQKDISLSTNCSFLSYPLLKMLSFYLLPSSLFAQFVYTLKIIVSYRLRSASHFNVFSTIFAVFFLVFQSFFVTFLSFLSYPSGDNCHLVYCCRQRSHFLILEIPPSSSIISINVAPFLFFSLFLLSFGPTYN